MGGARQIYVPKIGLSDGIVKAMWQYINQSIFLNPKKQKKIKILIRS
jgi:hypothetical protein